MNKLIERFNQFILQQSTEVQKKDMEKVVNVVFAEKKKKEKDEKALNKEKPKKKREPSEYNKFMKEQMAIIKKNEESMEKDDKMTAKAKMQYIAHLWKTNKERFVEAKSEQSDDSDSDSDSDVEKVQIIREPTPPPEPVLSTAKKYDKSGAKSSGNWKSKLNK